VSTPPPTVSPEYLLLYRIAVALERLVAATEAKQADEEPPVFPLGPILPKDRPRKAGGRGR
jgi:hypothetical protein